MEKNIDIDKLLLELKAIPRDIGIYPAAVKGYGEEADYEQRDGYKNGIKTASSQNL